MDPRLETCRRWLAYQARRAVADVFTAVPAPRERLLRRERLLHSALADAQSPRIAEEIRAAG